MVKSFYFVVKLYVILYGNYDVNIQYIATKRQHHTL